MAYDEIKMLLHRVWPGWEVVRLIGKGSFGTVYEIRKINGGRIDTAALKVISVPEEGASLPMSQTKQSLNSYYESVAEGMVREYEIMSRLRKSGCQNVVGCDSYVRVSNEDGLGLKLLIQMELLTDLNTHIRRNGIRRQDVVRLGIDICKALEICRREHVIHRDIKPANLFISGDGTYKLGDFGVAKRLEETGYAGSKQGTILYMAPEVYANREYDIRADLYSLGLVMYQLMNGGELPFSSGVLDSYGQSVSLSRRMRGEAIPVPAAENGVLADIVCRACAYDYKERYDQPMEMRHALEYLVDEEDETMYLLPVDIGVETHPTVEEREQVRIRFLSDDGEVLCSDVYNVGDTINIPSVLQKAGPDGERYEFTHWTPEVPAVATTSGEFRANYRKVESGKRRGVKKKVVRVTVACAVLCMVAAVVVGMLSLKNGWVSFRGETYYFYNFQKLTNWWKIGDSYYYFGNDGKMTTGWQAIDGKLYFFKPNGVMAERSEGEREWRWVQGKRYLLIPDGSKANGWLEVDGDIYYFDSTGAAVTGWQEIGGATYYFTSSGRMATGKWTMNNRTYYFNEDGTLKE